MTRRNNPMLMSAQMLSYICDLAIGLLHYADADTMYFGTGRYV